METEEKIKRAIIRSYRVQDIGGQLYIALPKEWAEDSSIEKGDTLTITANKDMRIVNPDGRNQEELYKKISEFVDEPVEKVREVVEKMEGKK